MHTYIRTNILTACWAGSLVCGAQVLHNDRCYLLDCMAKVGVLLRRLFGVFLLLHVHMFGEYGDNGVDRFAVYWLSVFCCVSMCFRYKYIVCVCEYMYKYIYACACLLLTCACVMYMYTFIYIYTCVYVCIYVCIYIYIYTYMYL